MLECPQEWNLPKNLFFLIISANLWGFCAGGHWPRKGVWGCAAVMTPFFQASRRSLAYQFTIIAPLICPPFSNFRKFFHFQPCFGQNFSSQDANFPNFRSLDPSFFKENPLPRPYFWEPVWHIPTKKKVECPPRDFVICFEIYAYLLASEKNKQVFLTSKNHGQSL